MDNKKEYNAYPSWLLPEKTYKINGWVARDLDGEINLFRNIPERSNGGFNDWYPRDDIAFNLDKDVFPGFKWEDEPVEVEITIKKKG